MTFTLTPGKATLADLARIYWNGEAIRLDRSARPDVDAAVARVNAAAQGDAPVYGVNTGFGKLAHVRIPAGDTAQLQRNLILSHCAGVGPALPAGIIRLTIALKLLSLGRGASGVRWKVIETLEALLEKNVTPIIPSQGSVGASGDLAPLAHMAAAMLGEGEAEYQGRAMPAAEALSAAGIEPIALGPKEGLALINGTQVSTALALAGLFEAWRLGISSLVTGAMSTDSAMGSTAPFRAEIHELRGHRGQIEAAAALRALMNGSEIREAHREGDERVQDPYCIRCQPQVAGAALDLLRQTAVTLEIEANAVTDNPLVLSDGSIVSGGNFHAEPVAFAADQIALAIAEIGAIAQRRVALMVDPNLNFHLPAFLSPAPGLNSGFMIAEVTSAALMSENKALANPRSVDSTPTSADQEDHVSMSCHAARRLLEMNDNLGRIIGIELLTSAQGIGLREKWKTSPALQRVIARLRQDVPALADDRFMSPDLEAAAALVRGNVLVETAHTDMLPVLMPGAMTENLHFQTIDQISAALRSSQITCSALTELMLDRIDKLNPVLNAFITVTPELARDAALQADSELAAGRDRGPLHGIPMAIKDLIDTAGVRTTYGSKLFENHMPQKDATVVSRLRQAGAVPLGKTGLHELAYGNTSINHFYGAIGNPWAPDHDPGGSSGGSAAAVAAGFCYAALGTDTGCSIRQPAHCCGIVGFKPSFGAVSKAGVFPLVWTMDHVGPLTRSVGDAAAIHSVISGFDPDDPYTAAAPPPVPSDEGSVSLAGKRLGVVRRFFFEGRDDVIKVVDAALRELVDQGAILVDLDIPDIEDAFAAAGTTFVEALAVHQKDFAEQPEGYSPYLRGRLENLLGITAVDYARAHHFRRGFIQRVEGLMSACDAMVSPTATITSAPIANRPDDYSRNAWKNTGISDFTGQPSISIPCGFTPAGLPVGLMITGARGADHAVLNIAAAIERETDWRRNPPL